MRAALALVLLLPALAACRHDRKPDLPGGTVVRPEAVIVERLVYVPVPAALTAELPIAEGPIAQCFDVAAQRRAAVQTANARFRAIRDIEGTPVPPGE